MVGSLWQAFLNPIKVTANTENKLKDSWVLTQETLLPGKWYFGHTLPAVPGAKEPTGDVPGVRNNLNPVGTGCMKLRS